MARPRKGRCDVRLTMYEADGDSVQAGYSCGCGCTPSSSYQRGGPIAIEGCCCGNEFAIGPRAEERLQPRAGFALETTDLTAPWGESITAAWMIGDSVHPEPEGHGAAHGHDHAHEAAGATSAIDPVCGMTVEPATAIGLGLHSHHEGTDHYFCGRGCKLEFDDDPARYLDPDYVPSM